MVFFRFCPVTSKSFIKSISLYLAVSSKNTQTSWCLLPGTFHLRPSEVLCLTCFTGVCIGIFSSTLAPRQWGTWGFVHPALFSQEASYFLGITWNFRKLLFFHKWKVSFSFIPVRIPPLLKQIRWRLPLAWMDFEMTGAVFTIQCQSLVNRDSGHPNLFYTETMECVVYQVELGNRSQEQCPWLWSAKVSLPH